jgi:hypothetical protein
MLLFPNWFDLSIFFPKIDYLPHKKFPIWAGPFPSKNPGLDPDQSAQMYKLIWIYMGAN